MLPELWAETGCILLAAFQVSPAESSSVELLSRVALATDEFVFRLWVSGDRTSEAK